MLPKYIKIGPIKYPITTDQKQLEHRDALAYIVFDEPEIILGETKSQTKNAAHLFHEIQHGVFLAANMDKGKTEEEVTACGNLWLTILLDTPDMLEYLMEIRDGKT